ncbi:LytTR family transcriptional regulator DNA-binding domain-containing protein [Slackia sp. CM382]
MNITLKEEPGRREIEVTIVAAPGDPRASRLVEALRAATGRLVGYAPNGDISQKIIPLDQVLYVETTERRAFIRTMDGTTLESPLRLYELEQALEGTEFMRISRQVLVNFDKVVSIVPEPNSRLILELDGGSRVVATRSYAPDIRRKLGALA